MNDSEKMHEIYSKLVDLDCKLALLQGVDVEMISFSDCSENGSHKLLLCGVSLFSKHLRYDIQEIYKIIDL